MSELGEILWTPDAARVARSNLAGFARRVGVSATDYDELHAWSVRDPEAYHSALWDFLGILGDKGGRAVRLDADIRRTRFFPEARLNYAENLLVEPDDRLALIAHRDDGTRRALTRKSLHDLVSVMVQALRARDIGPGDRVAGIVTNDVEAIALYLASAAIGAIWASCSPDFGPAGASDRLNQIEPKIVFAVPGYSYAGKWIDTHASIDAVAAAPSVASIVLLGDAPSAATYRKPHARLERWLAPFSPGPIAYYRQGFDAPLAILFSSGTTGRPKCIVHSAGGLLLQHKKEHVLHCGLNAGDRLFYYTTCGWMMWNWLITGLASGATLVTFDGNPAYPGPARLADLIDAEEITIFGTSAKYIDSCHKAGLTPRATHSLKSLKTILSTGSPLLPQSFDYIYADWKSDVHLASISGGTDICACFLGGVPTLPVRRGELQGAMLGMDVAAFDGEGHEVSGRPGELVCRNAHISMPVRFWGDPDGSRYAAAYFSRFPGVWAHGDFAERRPSGGFIISGRSDTTLNPGGVRIGTAEIYRQVETIPEVLEAICVGQDWRGDQRIVLFVKLRPGVELTEKLQQGIRARVRSGATPRHVPARIVAVPEIPRTRSGKISEIAVRDTIHGRAIGNDTALANPECLDAYRNLPQLAE
ncbi:MAG: acetoacetate--CoA ligase [Devosia sp. 67-54]|uniref:acetoacetate--CoA ligase n=1 Tax=unclassified Devosia TaxID=196773 RepID=UPI000969665C|nr:MULTISPECIES: acetoacetate--CoA ligase [unclassified Devosia]MBN9306691.1 acetoacetate--CoA ligase [Devosia sp.]OJX15964.1 MAG: acetoacetate--CoA ligase [Devosia sp. 67-54]